MDEKQLIQLIFPRKHRISINQLAQDASNSPNVDFLRVIGPDKQLRRPVPSRRYVISELLLVVILLEIPCKAKITNFQLLPITDQQVL